MTRSIEPDPLGQKSEARFCELCNDADLIANKAGYDRAGWDYAVDWRLGDTKAYDARETPRSCLVQVKTVWADTQSVTLRLSSAEHITRHIAPAFIVVLRVNTDKSFADLRVAHVSGDLLANVLKALRKARKDDAAPNTRTIELSLNKWFSPVEFSGSALKGAFEAAIGPSMAAYVERQQRDLKEVGFEHGRMILRTVVAASKDEITDAFLGLREIEAERLSADETRFGISIPVPELQSRAARLQITPKRADTSTLLFRTGRGGEAFSFAADMFTVPEALLGKTEIKALFRAPLFDMTLQGDMKPGHVTLKLWLETHPDKIRTAKLTARDWWGFYASIGHILSDGVQVEIKPKKASQPLLAKISLDGESPPEQIAQYKWAAQLSKLADQILTRAGWPGQKLRIRHIGEARTGLYLLDKLINAAEELDPIGYSTSANDVIDGQSFPMLYCNWFELGEFAIAYAASCDMRATISGDRARWTSGSLAFLDAVRIQRRQGEYKNFISRMQHESGVESYFAANMDVGAS